MAQEIKLADLRDFLASNEVTYAQEVGGIRKSFVITLTGMHKVTHNGFTVLTTTSMREAVNKYNSITS